MTRSALSGRTAASRSTPARRRRRAALPLLAVAVVLLLVAGVVAGVVLLRDGEDGPPPIAGVPAAADAAAPPLPAVGEAAGAPPSRMPDVLAPLLADPALGGPGAVVLDAARGDVLLGSRADASAIPASTTKVVTGAAVLAVLGEDARFSTRVLQAEPGVLVLVGGGDPTLTTLPAGSVAPEDGADGDAGEGAPDADAAPDPDGAAAAAVDPAEPARLPELAAQVAAAGLGPVQRLVVDASLFSGPATAQGWKPSYVTSGNVSPVSALAVDGGRVEPGRRARESDPAAAAGADFAALLTAAGVAGPKTVVPGQAPVGATPVAEVRSPPLATIVEEMLRTSDNDIAEALARHVALASGRPGDFTSAGRAVRDAVAGLGVPVAGVSLADGSGLSRDDRLTAGAVAGTLRAAAAQEQLRAVLTGLPVAGWTGTLSQRYVTDGSRADVLAATAAGDVRAKTGTLDGVSSLAGTTVVDGRLLVFAVLADRVPSGGTAAAERALDRVAATLAACGCG